MPGISLQETIGDINRFRRVVMVLFEEGLYFFVDDLRLRYLVPTSTRLRCALVRGAKECRRAVLGPEAAPPPEVRFRRAFERLGATFVKLGQILSTRPDLVPPQYIKEFAKLRDEVAPLPSGSAEQIVEKELGRPIKEIFRSFARKPLAAASLAQVHKAVLKDGTPVAVKVRRPGIDHVVRNDIHILAYLAYLLEQHVPASRRFRPMRIVKEFADWTVRELDFEFEGANIERFGQNFASDASIVIPKVFWKLSTQSVLTMELVEGVNIEDDAALKRAHIDKKNLALVGLRFGFKQLFTDGFFHGDPHPGNMTALPPLKPKDDGEPPSGPRLGLYDFGIVGSVSEKVRYELVSCFLSFVNKDTEMYIKHILDLAESLEEADIEAFSGEIRSMLTGVFYKPTAKKRLGQAFYNVLLSGAGRGVLFSRELLLVGKSLLTIENVGLSLYPDVDLEAELKPFLSEVFRQEFSPKKMAHDAQATAFDTFYFLKHLPEQTRLLLERLSSGQVGVKIDLQELRDLKAEFDRQNDVRVLAILAAAMLLASAAAIRMDQVAVNWGMDIGRLGFGVSMILILWVFFLVSKTPKP
jgi:ubiquinone biosynthesis protein